MKTLKEKYTMVRLWMAITAAAAIFCIAAPTAYAVEVEGIAFAETYQVEDIELHLRGSSLLRYLIFIDAYVGAFYMLPQEDARQALGRTPRRLELEYFHAISASDFAEATRQKVADNVPAATLATISDRLEEFNTFYQDVQPGDRYALTYRPGRGTELSLNGTPLGRIAGDDFAAAVFAIWLGTDPIDTDFRDALLGVR
jgi:Chalcone isomerase-like